MYFRKSCLAYARCSAKQQELLQYESTSFDKLYYLFELGNNLWASFNVNNFACFFIQWDPTEFLQLALLQPFWLIEQLFCLRWALLGFANGSIFISFYFHFVFARSYPVWPQFLLLTFCQKSFVCHVSKSMKSHWRGYFSLLFLPPTTFSLILEGLFELTRRTSFKGPLPCLACCFQNYRERRLM